MQMNLLASQILQGCGCTDATFTKEEQSKGLCLSGSEQASSSPQKSHHTL